MNWFQRLVARWILGRERLGLLVDNEDMDLRKQISWQARMIDYYRNEFNDCRKTNSNYREYTAPFSVPSSVHFRPNLSVDDIGGTDMVNGIPVIPPGHVMFSGPTIQWTNSWGKGWGSPVRSLPPIITVDDIEEARRHRDSQNLQHGPMGYTIGPDGIRRDTTPYDLAMVFRPPSPNDRPRMDATDPAYLGDMGPHMPYDYP